MPRPLWKGAISFGLVTIPVSLYPAKNARDSVAFHMLHSSDLRRVHNRWVDDAGHEVPYEEIVKGYEYEKGQYVVVGKADIEAAVVEATQSIDIMHFVDVTEIDVTFYDSPYYTEPAKVGRRAYALLRDTLERTGKVGVAKVVIRERQHLCSIMPDGPLLLAYTLRWPYQLRDPAELDVPADEAAGLDLSSEELHMAEQLVQAMATPWDPERYQDTYHDQLIQVIEERVRKGEIAMPPEPGPKEQPPTAEVVDITELLKKSVQQQKQKAGARK